MQQKVPGVGLRGWNRRFGVWGEFVGGLAVSEVCKDSDGSVKRWVGGLWSVPFPGNPARIEA